MKLDTIRQYCLGLPGSTEDVKWEDNLVFSIGGKMYTSMGIDQVPLSISFKVRDEEFEELSDRPNFRPAPYLARAKWILVEDVSSVEEERLRAYLKDAYQLVFEKLPKKVREKYKR